MHLHRNLFIFLVIGFCNSVSAQEGLTLYKSDSVELTFGAYADVYFGYDFNHPADKNRPYAVSSHRHDEIAINFAMLKFNLSSKRARLAFSPAIGTFMEVNYANEPPLFKNLYEGYAGFKPLKNKNLWLDAGIFTSPYTNESVLSMDQLTYTRSMGSENTPYYLSGLRASFPITQKINSKLYVLNGWQVIRANHHLQSYGVNVEYKPNPLWTINWSGFGGEVRTDSTPNYRNRFYSDLNANYNMDGKFSATFCVGYGMQDRLDTFNNSYRKTWYSGALQLRYRFKKKHAIAIKAEYYSDPTSILAAPVNNADGLVISSAALNYTWTVVQNVQFRLEGKRLVGKEKIYMDRKQLPTNSSNVFITSLAVKF